MIVIARSSTNPHAFSQCFQRLFKHASGARTVPAPICPIPASLWAIPVLMSGVMPVFYHCDECPVPGTRLKIPARDLQLHIALKVNFAISSDTAPGPLPYHPHRQARYAKALRSCHLRYQGFGNRATPISGFACSCEKPVKTKPCGVFTGANQRSPSPLTRIPNILPLRVIAVTMLPARIIAPASIAALQ